MARSSYWIHKSWIPASDHISHIIGSHNLKKAFIVPTLPSVTNLKNALATEIKKFLRLLNQQYIFKKAKCEFTKNWHLNIIWYDIFHHRACAKIILNYTGMYMLDISTYSHVELHALWMLLKCLCLRDMNNLETL